MKVYFSSAILGARKNLPNSKRIVQILKNNGAHVLSEHVVMDNVHDFECTKTHSEIYARDITWVDEAECLVAEISEPSLGVGVEVEHAAQRGIPILCLFPESSQRVSAMVCGNPRVKTKQYNEENLERTICEFLNSVARTKDI
ncbi:MAG: nucleoside 2-deoxyribosyltransferase [Candidatus Micrarchaeota archaeon]